MLANVNKKTQPSNEYRYQKTVGYLKTRIVKKVTGLSTFINAKKWNICRDLKWKCLPLQNESIKGPMEPIKTMKKTILLTMLMLLAILPIAAQENLEPSSEQHHLEDENKVGFVLGLHNFSFFDNREVKSPYQKSQTLFGAHVGAEVGVQLGANHIMAGALGVKNFGESGWVKETFTFYYYYEEGHFSGALGLFPRERLKTELPNIFLYDSLRYYSPTLNGALIQYTGRNGFAELYCNWLNKQGAYEREIFEIVTKGQFGSKGFYGGWNAQLMHYSVPENSEGIYVYDKIMLHPYAGFQTSKLKWLDALTVNAGAVLSLNRDRQDREWKTPLGFMGDVKLRKWRFELSDHLYWGEKQFSDYQRHGNQLFRGDPYYRSKLYNRTDLTFYLLNKSYVQCRVTASVHYTEQKIDNSQQIILHLFPDKDLLGKLFKR